VGDFRILDSISRSPAASSKSPAFYKQSQFPFNSTAKIAPECTKTRIFELKNRKISPDVTPSGERDIGASLWAPSASRSRRQRSSPAGLFLNLGSSASWRKTAGIEFVWRNCVIGQVGPNVVLHGTDVCRTCAVTMAFIAVRLAQSAINCTLSACHIRHRQSCRWNLPRKPLITPRDHPSQHVRPHAGYREGTGLH